MVVISTKSSTTESLESMVARSCCSELSASDATCGLDQRSPPSSTSSSNFTHLHTQRIARLVYSLVDHLVHRSVCFGSAHLAVSFHQEVPDAASVQSSAISQKISCVSGGWSGAGGGLRFLRVASASPPVPVPVVDVVASPSSRSSEPASSAPMPSRNLIRLLDSPSAIAEIKGVCVLVLAA